MHAAVVTGKGVGAIAGIELVGTCAHEVISEIFRSESGRSVDLSVGEIHAGNIVDEDRLIDNVVVARKSDDQFAINCHGNPLIVESIMEVLKGKGAALVDAEALAVCGFTIQSGDSIAAEAKIEQLKAVSLAGVKLIADQDGHGLGALARRWLADEDISVDTLKDECKSILEATERARYLIKGAIAVIAGPPNSGKSTLLNCLAGRQKAIVADVAGTTRDWVSINCRMGDVAVEVFDTAGLDEGLAGSDKLDEYSQKAAIDIIEKADVIVYLYDAAVQFDAAELGWVDDKKVVFAANKCDLLSDDQAAGCDDEHVRISADSGQGVGKLCECVLEELGVDGLDHGQAVCFTQRQEDLVGELLQIDDAEKAKCLITKLLNGELG